MISPKKFLKFLKKNKIENFCGVPDSVLKNFTLLIEDKKNNIIAANEGRAVAIAIGNYLSSKKISLVYMQNSGLGNAINPIVSIGHQNVYSIPAVLLIGWRGSGKKNSDEPQHLVKGKITKSLLKLIGVRFAELKNDYDFNKIKDLILYSKKNKKIVAILVKNNSFRKSIKRKKKIKTNSGLNRAFIIENIIEKISKKTKIISTTGYTSRELNQIRNENKKSKGKDFYMVGGMGHASMVALGCSIKTNEQILCLDGDGSLIMHMGSLISSGVKAKSNFKHILFNNGSHESVGGQEIDTRKINLRNIIKGFGYKKYYHSDSYISFKKNLDLFLKSKGPSFFEIKIKQGTLLNLKRPKNLKVVKKLFMN